MLMDQVLCRYSYAFEIKRKMGSNLNIFKKLNFSSLMDLNIVANMNTLLFSIVVYIFSYDSILINSGKHNII